MIRPLVFLLTVVGSLKNRLNREESGATAVEYGLLVGLIAVAIIVAVGLLGGKLNALFTAVVTTLP